MKRKDVTIDFFRRSSVEDANGCWIWQRGKNSQGYGTVRIGGISFRAHRIAYELSSGKIPKGMLVCHACDRPECVRPSHLFLGSHLANATDMARKGRCRQHVLSDSQIAEILSGARRLSVLAREFGVNYASVWKIRNRVAKQAEAA